MEDTDPVVCSDCGAEPDEATKTQTDLENEGWDFTGEFGARCPGCVTENAAPGNTATGVQDALGGLVTITDKPKKAKSKAKVKAKKPKRKPAKKEPAQ